ncbi:hypothetical protein CYY_008151 [Polysphondylium violaceum]|uniref:Uncharacterized protein n=1 Tax=Polysphondylium violaceum TaxID=133409 RepID=A0A8J4PNC7_9MYCE|nr:hypothetical protein CYY_008151 [Polysphondylium violaceum]
MKGCNILLVLIVVLLVSLSVNNVLSETCMSDELLTGTSKHVDWWFIIKIKGFSDVYYYYDSDMDAKEEETFKTGYFLRSKFSAFGATLLPYANQDGDGKKITTLKTNFIAYNDHFNIIEKIKKTEDSKFYTEGAHEKGLIGWSTQNAGKGLIIQHSLPNFPNGNDRGMFQPVMNDNIKALNGKLGDKGQEIKMYFTMYGWKTNIFAPNLMPYHIPGRKFYKTPEEVKPNQHNYGTRTQTGSLNQPKMIAYTTTSQYELFSLLYTTTVKPSQQIFCSSLVDDDQSAGAGPGKKVKEMVEFMSGLSDVGLYAGKYNEIDKSFTGKDSTGKDIQHVSYPYHSFQKTRTSGTTPTFVEKEIKVGQYDYYMRINDQSDGANGGQGKVNDIWNSLTLSSKEPKLATTDLKTLAISTWTRSKEASWWKDKIVSPVFKITVHDNTFKWVGNSNQEHSKIAFRTQENDSDKWNVCSSGGNLYGTSKTQIKSSLLICFKAKGLRKAFESIMTTEDDMNDDIEASTDDGEEEEAQAVKEPAKFNQKEGFLKTIKDGVFKTELTLNLQNAKHMSNEMDALLKRTNHVFNFTPKLSNNNHHDYYITTGDPIRQANGKRLAYDQGQRQTPTKNGGNFEVSLNDPSVGAEGFLQEKIDLTVPSNVFAELK